jgi:hypothetical protein
VERLWQYQRHAAECLLLAEQVADPADKAGLLAMAQAWSRLADLAERNARTDVVYETPREQKRPSDQTVLLKDVIQARTTASRRAGA